MENNDLNQAKGSQKSKTQIAIENAKWIWLGATIIFFVLLIVFYHNLHQKTQGKELRYFTSDEIGVINNIYLQSQHNDSITEDETEKLVLFYIKTILEVNGEGKTANFETVSEIEKFVKTHNLQSFITILPSYPLTIDSYFWLKGKRVLMEIIFWTIFGVMASFLHRGTEAMKNDDFNLLEVPSQLAKLIYAPIISLIIYLSLDKFTNEGLIEVSTASNNAIILSFLLGFFSGRAILLLHKIKSLILPKGDDDTTSSKHQITGNIQFAENILNPPISKLKNAIVELYSEKQKQTVKKLSPFEDGTYHIENIGRGEYKVIVNLKDGDNKYTCEQKILVKGILKTSTITNYLKKK